MPYTSVTRAQLRTMLQAKWDGVPFWTDTEANIAINEAIQWYGLYTGVWQQRVNVTTVADQAIYTTTTPLLCPTRMEFNGKSIAMTSIADLDSGRPGWQTETTADVGTPSTVQLWAPVGLMAFAIWPADAVGQNSLLFDGVRRAPTLDTDGAKLDLDSSEVDPLLGEALHIAAFKDPARLARTTGWHQQFLRTVMAHNGRLNASDLFRQAQGTDVARQTNGPSR